MIRVVADAVLVECEYCFYTVLMDVCGDDLLDYKMWPACGK